jgi:hypothetical protein
MSKQTGQNAKIGPSHAIRDVFVTALNKGQFPLAIIGLIILVLIWRMPNQDVSKLVFEILADLKAGYLAGWGLTVITSLGWFFHAKHIRRVMQNEFNRISKERTEQQEKRLNKSLPSSNKNKRIDT